MRRERRGAVLDAEGPEAPEPGRGEAQAPPTPRPPLASQSPGVSPSPPRGKGPCSIPFMTPRAAGPEKRLFLQGGGPHLCPVTVTGTWK